MDVAVQTPRAPPPCEAGTFERFVGSVQTALVATTPRTSLTWFRQALPALTRSIRPQEPTAVARRITNEHYTSRPLSPQITRRHENHSMAATSTLSSLSRTPTPLSKYHTADEGASNPGLEDVTDISSPGEAVDGAGDDDFSVKVPYHAARNLPEELKSRVQIHLEEQTCEKMQSLLSRET